MGKPKSSPIWLELNDKEFIELVENSKSIKEILAFFALENKGHNYRTLKNRIKKLKIDTSHLAKNYDVMVQNNLKKKTPIKEILVENSNYNKSHLKKRVMKEGFLEDRCYICGLSKKWNDKPIIMVLDHINGVDNDNRLENLRLVCPNCNSQLNTHCGKNKFRKSYKCTDCGAEIGKFAKRCVKCNSKIRRKVTRPSLDRLKSEISKFGFSAVGRKYGVSDNAIRKWIKHTT